MNCTELFLQKAKTQPRSLALMIPGKELVTFGELLEMASKAQNLFQSYHLGPGTSVLLMDSLGSRLYASIIALLATGTQVILVEPWMPVEKIQRTIDLCRPRLFISNPLGFLWGARVKAVRQIPHWVQASQMRTAKAGTLHLEDVSAENPGILTFTSGTTGEPKGVVRNQGYLIKQHEVLSHHLEASRFHGPDLCIFANFVLTNLASGRGSILVPPSWKPQVLQALDDLPITYQPETLTTGPAFLKRLMTHARASHLKSIHIGGALTDCDLFETAFRQWPDAHISHIYGGSEVEPVALVDAHQAVHESKRRGFFQTLFLGKNVPEITPQLAENGLWVSGPHVCPEYFGNSRENELYKRKDADGMLWHFMGDRIVKDQAGWWYQGRSGQKTEDFLLEQKIYMTLGSSKSFIHLRNSERWLVGDGLSHREREILQEFPELTGVAHARIYRDRRHRARIDRNKTLRKGAKWLVGEST